MYRSFKEAMAVAEADHDWWEIVIYPAQKDTADADACMFELTGYEAAEGEYPFTILGNRDMVKQIQVRWE